MAWCAPHVCDYCFCFPSDGACNGCDCYITILACVTEYRSDPYVIAHAPDPYVSGLSFYSILSVIVRCCLSFDLAQITFAVAPDQSAFP